jgi:SAM-dependent methyltransferase
VTDPKDIVRAGYDAVSYAYRGDDEDEHCAEYHAWLDELVPLLTPGAPVLDLGCGRGVPVARRLASTHRVTGVDLSPIQVERARHNVPEGQFICADMTEVAFPEKHFYAVVSFYAIIHVPLDEQIALLHKMHRWLRPGGYLMATVGHGAWTGQEENWLDAGAAMYWSHADEATYLGWLKEAGFEVSWTRFIPEEDGGHTLLLARKATPPADPSLEENF